ncbi:MAG: TaqI-like C-terminal specificity domain-containing protein [Prolixibacteraceae bacterium]|nr:TaqI-like C-terminal specificity domain-containing protein [Prolixibacteraceae bacterium]
MKEKGLVPEALFDKNKITGTLQAFNPNAEDNSDYYKAILQNLFFATLNTEMPKDGGNRVFIDDKKKNKNTGYTEEYMDHLVFRYKNRFVNPDEGLKLFENIPFLNGGLFECLDRRDPETNVEMRIDGFSSTPSKQPVVPNVLFFGRNDDLDLSSEFEDKNKYKHCKARGIINILNSYKFTIEENTPLEQEIALDPELLGKIFENLLASYNPETRTTARKQTGSYYTPREIVNYMVDESLMAYLKTYLNCDSNDLCDGHDEKTDENHGNQNNHTNHSPDHLLRQLFAYESEDNPFAGDEETARNIINALSECKILDPACGSGAFPMGILHKMVFVLGKLDPCNYTWKQAQLEKAQRDKQRAQQFEDETLRETALKSADDKIAYIEASFGETGHELDYARKLFLIENCIYGVDIQQIAVQISKLRFFISLMVDQRVDDAKPNRNILSLPNLETKFVAANTLIPVDKPQQGTIISMDANVKRVEEELHEIRQRIFFTKKWPDKKKLKKQEREKRKELEKALISSGFPAGSAGQIASWDPFDPLHSAPFFDPEVMFTIEKDKQGGHFDVVIGNPPYIEHKKLKYISSELKKHYKVYAGTADLYVYFYEQGINALKNKGTSTLVTSNKFIKTEYGKNLREFLTSNYLKEIIDFTDIHIFDALVASSVVITLKEKRESYNTIFVSCNDSTFEIGLSAFVNQNRLLIKNDLLNPELWLLDKIGHLSLKNKIESNGSKIKDIDSMYCYRGITTGFNPAFIIDITKRNEFLENNKNNSEFIKPLLQGRNIRKWVYKGSNEYLLFIPWHFPLHKNPDITGSSTIAEKAFKEKYKDLYNHLEIFKEELSKRNSDETGIRYEWYALQRCANTYYEEFDKSEKIIWGLTADKWAFAYDDKKHFLPSNGYILTSSKIPLKYILSILNSRLMRFYFGFIGIMTAGGAFTLKQNTISELPMKLTQNNTLFIKLVDKILKNSEMVELVMTCETRLDLMVYKLYNLSYDECLIVDPEIEKLISREDYEKKSIEELAGYNV